MYLGLSDDALRREAERLVSLTPEERKKELVYQSLRLGRQSEVAADELAQIDRDMLSDLFPEVAEKPGMSYSDWSKTVIERMAESLRVPIEVLEGSSTSFAKPTSPDA